MQMLVPIVWGGS